VALAVQVVVVVKVQHQALVKRAVQAMKVHIAQPKVRLAAMAVFKQVMLVVAVAQRVMVIEVVAVMMLVLVVVEKVHTHHLVVLQ
jgi:hypothetical protein